MTHEEIVAKLTEIFHEVFDNEDIVLSRATTAADIEGWDSFNNINIMVATEMAFGVKFMTAEVEQFKNVGDLIDKIAQKLAAK